jgi:PhnB protein
MTRLNPYISFRGTAREAMEFYRSVFGGELDLSTFSDFQMPGIAEDESNLIMHGQLEAPGGMVLMGADTPASMELPEGSSITISLSGDDEAELRGYWDKLAEGGSITLPLEVAPWGDAFGQLTDRFGVSWMVNIAGSGGAAAETEDTAVSA